jgi:hypothetical protein
MPSASSLSLLPTIPEASSDLSKSKPTSSKSTRRCRPRRLTSFPMPYTSSAHLAAPRSPRDDTVYICVLTQNTNATKPTPHFQAFPLPPGELSPAPSPSPDYSWEYGYVLQDAQGDIFTDAQGAMVVMGVQVPHAGGANFQHWECYLCSRSDLDQFQEE